MIDHVFTGFGFGPIQGGLFAKEAFESGNFRRIVVAEIDAELVDAVRAHQGSYFVNVAHRDGIEAVRIENVELLNPNIIEDRKILREALGESTEIATSLPSVDYYDVGGDNSVAALIAEGLKSKRTAATIIYAAENNNHAAQVLQKAVGSQAPASGGRKVEFLNTVIAKMSQVVADPKEIARFDLTPIAPGIERAFLVEEFNRILVDRVTITDWEGGIQVFEARDELLPFEEAKLFGHNAVHALLAYLGALKGYQKMTELKHDDAIMQIGREAFLQESGSALIRKYGHLNDQLFTEAGYKKYCDDLLERMTNPFLNDSIERAGRDLRRKLAYDDRIFGTMALALEQNVEPTNMALGAMAGLAVLLKKANENNVPGELRFDSWRTLDHEEIEKLVNWIWGEQQGRYSDRLIQYVQQACEPLARLFV